MAGGIERDAGRGRSKARETPRPAIRADRDDARMAAGVESEDRAIVDRAPARGPPVIPRHTEIRLGALSGGIAARSARERGDSPGPAQEEQPPRRRDDERPVAARSDIHDTGQMKGLHPVRRGQPRSLVNSATRGAGRQRHARDQADYDSSPNMLPHDRPSLQSARRARAPRHDRTPMPESESAAPRKDPIVDAPGAAGSSAACFGARLPPWLRSPPP